MVLKSVILGFHLQFFQKRDLQYCGLGRQCHKFQALYLSVKFLACVLFVGFPRRLPVCGVQTSGVQWQAPCQYTLCLFEL